MTRLLGPARVLQGLRFYPPYLGAGVRVTRVSEALDVLEVEMPLRPWNRNYVGTQFGGSLYSMCDPFFMLLAMMRLGPGYVVWDKSASIEFLKPGRGRVRARFELTEETLETIRAGVERDGKVNPTFEVTVRDEQGNPVARVKKVLSIRKKAQS